MVPYGNFKDARVGLFVFTYASMNIESMEVLNNPLNKGILKLYV